MNHNWSPQLRADLRRCFSYDPITGVVSRIARTSLFGPFNLGPVGSLRKGYLFTSISVGGKSINIPLHRLAYFFLTGELPPTVDHVDGIRSNNKAGNLRSATIKQNSRNRRRKSGRDLNLPVGVYLVKRKDRPNRAPLYRVEVMCERRKYVNEFATADRAIAWRDTKAKELFGTFAPALEMRAHGLPETVTDQNELESEPAAVSAAGHAPEGARE